ncbi:MAG: hypothetical protein KF690_05360 [Bacteroidetes bacterium]|nr:hypothetical protein [Bacteroidota bacterium]
MKQGLSSLVRQAWFRPVMLLLGVVLLVAFQGKNILWFGPYGGGPVFLLLSLGLGWALYRWWPQEAPVSTRAGIHPLLWGVLGLGLLACAVKTHLIAQAFPLDPYSGDIIPTLKIYTGRFLQGDRVYSPIAIGKHVYEAGYPPLMWLPFVPAEWLGLDYRLMALLVFALGLGVVQYRVIWRSQLPLRLQLTLTFVPWVLYYIFLEVATADVGYSIEPMSYGFHLLFFAFCWHRKPGVKAAVVILLLLSRYMLVLWVPLYALIVVRYWGWRHAAQVLGWALALGLLFLALFMWHDPAVLLRSQQSYVQSALDEWAPDRIWDASGLPYHIGRGRGLAVYAYRWGGGDLLQRVELMRMLQLGLLLAVIVSFGIMALRVPRQRLHALLVASAVVYLAVFLDFLQVPYGYLHGNLTWWGLAAYLVVLSRKRPNA